jgi:hypothetical protein
MSTIEERLEKIFKPTNNTDINSTMEPEPTDSNLVRTYVRDEDERDDEHGEQYKEKNKHKMKHNYKNIESFETISKERKHKVSFREAKSGIEPDTPTVELSGETEGFKSGMTSKNTDNLFKKIMKVLKKIISFFKSSGSSFEPTIL